MAENSGIEWTDHTFNPWIGCQKVGPGCDNCYAETWDKRFDGGKRWGAGATRTRTSPQNWNQPRKWNKEAAATGKRPRVFCASLADVFDNAVPQAWRDDLFQLIKETQHLDWILLTKRIGNVKKMLPPAFVAGQFDHVGIMVSVVTQAEAQRDIPILLDTPAAWRGLSMEPLIENVRISGLDMPRLDWVIVGGESGKNARPLHPEWVKTLQIQCEFDGVPFFFKQWGEWIPISQYKDSDSLYFPPPEDDPDAITKCKYDSAVLQLDGSIEDRFPRGAMTIFRIGKKKAGRLLNGREYNEPPRKRGF